MPNSEKTITIDNFVSRIVNPTSRLAETIQISLQPVHELVGRVYKLASEPKYSSKDSCTKILY